MSRSLGIYVSSDQHLDKLMELCRAAKRKDIEVRLFFPTSVLGCARIR